MAAVLALQAFNFELIGKLSTVQQELDGLAIQANERFSAVVYVCSPFDVRSRHLVGRHADSTARCSK